MTDEQKTVDSSSTDADKDNAKQQEDSQGDTGQQVQQGDMTSQTDDATAQAPKEEADDPNHPGWNTITQDSMIRALGADAFAGAIGNEAEIKARQHIINPKKYKTDFKKPNPGKMPNNQDPFPVDLKIEEFETHYPPTRIYKLTTPNEGKVACEAAMNVGMNADKRLVKIENNLSTLFRLFFRLGTRVRINCVYYGGQSPFMKYAGIRCLADDRVSDGQNVQIDQCLYCTRYEPIDGQCYEILNDIGANVAFIQDDNQMSYNMMSDYINMSRVEQFHKEKSKSIKTNTGVLTRNPDEKDFSNTWGSGVVMNWSYVPKEDQKTHINWRQSINDDGQNMKRLASWPCSEANQGPNIVDNKKTSNIMTQNKEAMDNYKPDSGNSSGSDSGSGQKSTDLTPYINAGKGLEGDRDVIANEFRGGEMTALKEAAKGSNADPLTLACYAYVQKQTNYTDLVKKYSDAATALSTTNPAIIICAMVTTPETFLGGNGKPRIDELSKKKDEGSSSSDKPKSSNNSSSSSGGGDTKTLNWDERDKWLWVDFAPFWLQQVDANTQVADVFPKVCYAYCFVKPLCSNSRFDEDDFGFPFFDEQFQNGDEINYYAPYGPRSASKMHYGIDLGADEGVEIHAVADGTVKEDGNGDAWGPWHGICIQHDDNQTYSRYLHCSTMSVTPGQHVSRGDVIGTVGGFSGYDPHLHLEISPGDAISSKSQNDPLTYFPKFQSEMSVGQFLTPTPSSNATQANQS